MKKCSSHSKTSKVSYLLHSQSLVCSMSVDIVINCTFVTHQKHKQMYNFCTMDNYKRTNVQFTLNVHCTIHVQCRHLLTTTWSYAVSHRECTALW